MTAGASRGLKVRLGFVSETGRRADNQDYVGAHLGSDTRGTVAAIADGVGGHLGGRQAAELTVRAFIDGYLSMPETLGVQKAAARSLHAVNAWIHAIGARDENLSGMACTFSALVLSRRSGHILHIGDSRIYRLSERQFDRLTTDHVLGRGDLAHVLQRAVGFDASAMIDHAVVSLRLHDRFLICTDGVHGALGDARLRAILETRAAPEETAREIVAAALQARSDDNASALVLDVVDLPLAEASELQSAFAELPILKSPQVGETVDGFTLRDVISTGPYSRLFRASDGEESFALKFPLPSAASDRAFRQAFVREAWVAGRVRSRWIGETIELPPGRQTRLYLATPFYEGETLEQRLKRSALTLTTGVRIAVMLARAVDALHRIGVIHRDLKPENVILTNDGGLRLIDLGVARVPGMEELPVVDIPGTSSFMAPELFQGRTAGDEATDLYALGVCVYRLFTGGYPYGEVDPFAKPRFGKYISISRARPDLPVWLDVFLAKAVAVDPAQRFTDATGLAHELEHSLQRGMPATILPRALIERDPVRFWQLIALALLIVVLVLLAKLSPYPLR